MKIIAHKVFFITIAILVGVTIYTKKSWESHKEYPYQFKYDSDVNQFYSYLVAGVIHKDLSFKYKNNRGYWLTKNKNGNNLPRTTIGMSLMYSPFFVIGHVVALSSDYKADGYSLPYSNWLKIGTYFYVIFAFYLLYLSLLYFFKPLIAGISILVTFLGTNLFYYTLAEGEMSHSYLFFLFSIIIYFTIKWHRYQKRRQLFILAFFLGLSVLIRPTSIILVLFPLLYGSSITAKIKVLLSNWKSLILAIPVFLIPIFLQMLYWKIYGGNWIIWSYGEEHFYFKNPHILDFLFSYRKGWLLYTPVMVLAVFGLFKLNKTIKQMRFVIPIILIIVIYVLSSWWSWWFGGSLGSRVMVEFYALLIFPLASAIYYFSKIKYATIGLVLALSFCIFYNMLATNKYRWSQLHWDSMTKESFWQTFSHLNMNHQQKQKFNKLLSPPDYEYAKKGLEERK